MNTTNTGQHAGEPRQLPNRAPSNPAPVKAGVGWHHGRRPAMWQSAAKHEGKTLEVPVVKPAFPPFFGADQTLFDYADAEFDQVPGEVLDMLHAQVLWVKAARTQWRCLSRAAHILAKPAGELAQRFGENPDSYMGLLAALAEAEAQHRATALLFREMATRVMCAAARHQVAAKVAA